MEEVKSDLPLPSWQAYVTTIKCDIIDDYVSLMVKKDWSSKCTWYNEYKEPISDDKRRPKPDKKTRRKIELCKGPMCNYLTECRDRLMKEEQDLMGAS